MEKAKRRGTLVAILKKELMLATPRAMYLFAILGIMTFIPSYPSIVGIGYCALAVFSIDERRRANRDIEFTSALPVARKSVVTGKALFLAVFQGAFLFFASLGALLARFVISPNGNIVGLDANFTFFGVALLSLGAFNAIYLPGFFKTGYKSGLPVLLGTFGFIGGYGLAEVLVNLVPGASAVFDGYGASGLWLRVIVFLAGVAVYTVGLILATKRAQKRFEKVNL